MATIYFPEYADSAKQYGELIFTHDQLYKELDEKRSRNELTIWEWVHEHAALNEMRKEIDAQYHYVRSAMNTIIHTKEHPEGTHDKELCRIFLSTAYPDVETESFCIMQ